MTLGSVTVGVALLLTLGPSIAGAQIPRAGGWMVDDDTTGATFGYIQSVAADSRGRTYVLDVGQQVLLVFDEAGRLIGRAGRAGFGPGEFSSPQALLVDDRDRVLVVDARQRRLSEFGWRGVRLVHVRDHLLARDAYSACVRSDSVFVLGRMSEDIVSLYVRTDAGAYRLATSFGVLRSRHQQFAHPIVRALRSDALLACSRESPTLVAIARQVGELQRFRGLGDSGTIEAVAGFSGITMVVSDGAVENRLPETGVADATQAAVLADSATLLVSIGEVVGAAANRNLLRGYRLVQMDFRGHTVRQERSSWILGHVGVRGVVCYRNDPGPAVKVVVAIRASPSICNAAVAR